MRRVAMISEHASPVATMGSADCGGQNVYVDQVSRGLARLGWQVDIYTRADSPDLAPIPWSEGVRILPVRAGPLASIPKDDIWPHIEEFLQSAEDLFSRYGPYDLIHGNFWMSGWVGARLKRSRRTPLVQIFHALGAVKRKYQGDADTSPSDRLAAERFVVESADLLLAQCPSERAELIELYDADPARIRVVPSGVDLERFFPVPRDEARQVLGLSLDERIAVYVGRLLPRKDVANVIEAFGLLMGEGARWNVGVQVEGECLTALAIPERAQAAWTERPIQAGSIAATPAARGNYRLLVVGGETPDADLAREPEMRRLIARAGALGVGDRVTFIGRRPGDRLRWYYSAADVFVTTPWYEPYGLTPLEAMACGTPAICSGVGGITFTVADGETGYLVPPRRPDLLAEKLDLILRDDARRAQLGRNAWRRVQGEFTWATVAERTARVFAEVLPRARRAA